MSYSIIAVRSIGKRKLIDSSSDKIRPIIIRWNDVLLSKIYMIHVVRNMEKNDSFRKKRYHYKCSKKFWWRKIDVLISRIWWQIAQYDHLCVLLTAMASTMNITLYILYNTMIFISDYLSKPFIFSVFFLFLRY